MVGSGGASGTKILWSGVWSPGIEFESWSDAQYACGAPFSPSGVRSSPRWGQLIKLIHSELSETKSKMGQVSHPERDRVRDGAS